MTTAPDGPQAPPVAVVASAARATLAVAGLVPGVIGSLLRNREQIVRALAQAPANPSASVASLLAAGTDGLGEQIVRAVLTIMDDDAARADLFAAAGAVSGSAGALAPVLEAVQPMVVDPVAAALGLPDARMRAALITATLGGLVGARCVLRIDPLASASVDEVAALVGPQVQRLLDREA